MIKTLHKQHGPRQKYLQNNMHMPSGTSEALNMVYILQYSPRSGASRAALEDMGHIEGLG